MASIQRRPDGSWRARYRDRASKEHAKHFQTKRAAQEWLDGVAASVRIGTYADPGRSRRLVSHVAESWLASKLDSKASTAARNRGVLDVHILPRWGARKVGEIEQGDVQEWVSELARTHLSARTIRKIYFVLNGVMKHAVSLKCLAVNPCTGVNLPRASTAPRRYLTATQVEQLAAAAGEAAPIVLTLAYTGLRWGELGALRIRNVDLVRGRLIIEASVTEVNGTLEWTTPKDHQRRTVPIPDFLRAYLESAMMARSADDLLFPAPRGGVLRVRAARRGWFDRASTAAGVDGLSPSELRHTAASLAVHAGAHVLAVQRMLGHEKASMTLDVYSDLFDGDLDLVAERLDEVRSRGAADFLRTQTSKQALRLA